LCNEKLGAEEVFFAQFADFADALKGRGRTISKSSL
jgi:hypothetical protein